MANVTGSSITSQKVNAFTPDLTFLVISFIFAIVAMILNSVEIRLISRKWEKATNFEVILFHLAIADLLSSIGNLFTCCFLLYFIIRKSLINAAYLWFSFGLLGFFYTVSMEIVLIIGVERLLAIKIPLKHRLWHTTHKTLHRQIFAAWSVSAIVICSAVLSDYFIQKAKSSKGQSIIPSLAVGYTVAGYQTFGVTVVLVCYCWLLHIILIRATHLLIVNKDDYKLNPKIMKRAMKKEKATVIVCWIVLISFLLCNIPIIVDNFRGKISSWAVLLSNLNAVLNPLIYFFKGYIEKKQSTKRLVSALDDGSVDARSKHGVTSPNPPIISHEIIELGIVNDAVNGETGKSINKGEDGGEARSKHRVTSPNPPIISHEVIEFGIVNEAVNGETGKSINKGEDGGEDFAKSDALVELYLSREVVHGDGSKSTDQESGDKGDSFSSNLSKVKLGFADEISIDDEPLPNGKAKEHNRGVKGQR